jgi:hypothetical protein
MAVVSASVSVTTSATLLADSEHCCLLPPTAIYVGPSGVTTGNGYLLTAGVEYYFDLPGDDALYGVAASGTVVVPVLRTGA